VKVKGDLVKSLNRKTVVVGLALAAVFVVIGNFVFSYALETLDVQAERLGLSGENVLEAPFPEYAIPGFDSIWGSVLLGIASLFLIFTVTIVVANLLKKKGQDS
jgi:type III secretory pathway component EscU